MDYIYLNLFSRQLDQRVAQCFHRTIHVTLNDDVQFLEVTQCNTTAQFIQCKNLLCTQALFTSQLFTLVRNLTSFLIAFNNMECVTCGRSTVQSQNQCRFGRSCLFHPLITFIEHSLHTSIAGSCQYDVSDFQSTVGHQYRSYITTSFIQRRFNDRSCCITVRIRFQIKHLSFQQYFLHQIFHTYTFLGRDIL